MLKYLNNQSSIYIYIHFYYIEISLLIFLAIIFYMEAYLRTLEKG